MTPRGSADIEIRTREPACSDRPGELETLLDGLLTLIAPDAGVRVSVSVSEQEDLESSVDDSDYALYLALGRDAERAEHRLASVSRELEVVEYCGALVALYLEEGLSESPAGYFGCVGLRYLRERIDRDPGGRAALFRRALRARGGRPRCIARARTG
jgi:hypothetical protein